MYKYAQFKYMKFKDITILSKYVIIFICIFNNLFMFIPIK